MTIEEFLSNQDLNRQWITWKKTLHVYLRKQSILDERGRRLEVLALANMGNSKPGKGLYRELLAYLYHKLPEQYQGIYVENVQEKRFFEFHLQRQQGWQQLKRPDCGDLLLLWIHPQRTHQGK